MHIVVDINGKLLNQNQLMEKIIGANETAHIGAQEIFKNWPSKFNLWCTRDIWFTPERPVYIYRKVQITITIIEHIVYIKNAIC